MLAKLIGFFLSAVVAAVIGLYVDEYGVSHFPFLPRPASVSGQPADGGGTGSQSQRPPQITTETRPQLTHERFAAAGTDWEGGQEVSVSWYGRRSSAIYGALSDHPHGTATIHIDGNPTGEGILTIDGLDDELGGSNPTAIAVNGRIIFEGESPFVTWDGSIPASNWTKQSFQIDSGMLVAGENTITVANLAQTSNWNEPPYVLLGAIVVEVDVLR